MERRWNSLASDGAARRPFPGVSAIPTPVAWWMTSVIQIGDRSRFRTPAPGRAIELSSVSVWMRQIGAC